MSRQAQTPAFHHHQEPRAQETLSRILHTVEEERQTQGILSETDHILGQKLVLTNTKELK